MSYLRVGLDLDDTCNEFWNPYIKRFTKPNQTDYEITRNVRKLCFDREFWTTLPVKHRPNFDVTLYCTKRINPKSYSKKWLEDNDYPKAPLYQMYYQYGNKATMIKGRVDVFVDDSIRNVIDMNLAGVPCLLMDSPANQSYGPIGRVYSLDYEEIEDTYNMFIDQVFPNYKKFIL